MPNQASIRLSLKLILLAGGVSGCATLGIPFPEIRPAVQTAVASHVSLIRRPVHRLSHSTVVKDEPLTTEAEEIEPLIDGSVPTAEDEESVPMTDLEVGEPVDTLAEDPESGLTTEDTEEEGDKTEEPEEEEEEEEEPETLLSFIPHTTGGLSVESVYTGEVFSNTRGGINTNHATHYRGNLDLMINGDMDELFGISGASFFIYGGSMHGKSVTYDDVGDWQVLSSIDPNPYVDLTQIQEHWVRQEFLDGKAYIKIGRQDANADFGFADLSGDFINNTFVTNPTIPFPVWPFQSLGASGFVELSDNVTLGAGIYQSNKFGGLWGDPVSAGDGCIGMGHLEWKTQVGPESQLPGTWRVGSWCDSGQWKQISSAPVAKVYNNNYGFFCSGDQLLFKEEYGTDDEQGFGVFFQFGWAPGERNFVQESYAAGVVYRGLIPERDLDVCGLGYVDIRFGQATRDRDGMFYENATEVFYKAQINDFLVIQPDLQFIANPGGHGRDALVAGIRFEMTL